MEWNGVEWSRLNRVHAVQVHKTRLLSGPGHRPRGKRGARHHHPGVCFTGTDASAELHKHCGSTNGTPMLMVDNFNFESISQGPIPQPVGAVSAIDIDTASVFDVALPPTLVATVAASELAPPATVDMTTVVPGARDFSAPVLMVDNFNLEPQAVLHIVGADDNPADILTKPLFDVDTSAATAPALPAHNTAAPRQSRGCIATWMPCIHSQPCLRSSRHTHAHGLQATFCLSRGWTQLHIMSCP